MVIADTLVRVVCSQWEMVHLCNPESIHRNLDHVCTGSHKVKVTGAKKCLVSFLDCRLLNVDLQTS